MTQEEWKPIETIAPPADGYVQIKNVWGPMLFHCLPNAHKSTVAMARGLGATHWREWPRTNQ
jgi:hypothetical protein